MRPGESCDWASPRRSSIAASEGLEGAATQGDRHFPAVQRPDGAFLPLWFGNQSAPAESNPTYGTARVVIALAAWKRRGHRGVDAMLLAGSRWLRDTRDPDGGWGADRGLSSSIEETGLAIGALADGAAAAGSLDGIAPAVTEACDWLGTATEGARTFAATPIGLYFAKLWYSESLYPLLFAVEGLGRAQRSLDLATSYEGREPSRDSQRRSIADPSTEDV